MTLLLVIALSTLGQGGDANNREPPSLAIEQDEAVETGREVLGRRWLTRTHPWYDRDNDGVRLVPLPKPKKTREPRQPPQWWTAFIEWLRAHYVVGIVLLAMALALVVYRLYRLYLARRKYQSPADDGDGLRLTEVDRMQALPAEADVDEDDLLAAARRRYEAGDYRLAMILLFSHLLVALDAHHVIRLAKGKTNGQYLREIGPAARLRAIFAEAVKMFEAVFFGGHPITRERFETCWREVEEFQRLLDGERR